MASPDLSEYHQLTLYDRTAAELVARALLDAAEKLPGWVPREGNTEVVLIESLAVVVAELVYAINRVPDATAEILLRLYGITRGEGLPPTTTVIFSLADNAGHVIEAGTVVRLVLGDPADPIDFTTDEDLVVPAGDVVSAPVAATGSRNTDEANGTPAGADLELVTALSFVNTVETASAVAGGAPPEDQVAWLTRGRQRLDRLTDVLVRPSHFTAAALENPLVARAFVLDNHDGVAANQLGHVAVAVGGAGGVALGAGDKAAIEADLEDRAQVNLDVHVIDPTVTAVAVTATVRRVAGYTEDAVDANVVAAINAYLDPDDWEWGSTVRRNELIAVIDRAEGVDFVEVLAAPAADVVLAGVAPLADAGAIDITVNAP